MVLGVVRAVVEAVVVVVVVVVGRGFLVGNVRGFSGTGYL